MVKIDTRTVRTRTVRLPYGEGHISVKVPERYLKSVVEPRKMPPIPDPILEMDQALAMPMNSPSLKEMAERGRSPCILVSDSTRPTPSGFIASQALGVLKEAGVEEDEVKIVVATGLHRPCTEGELVERIGKDIMSRTRVLSHDAYDSSNLVYAGSTSRNTPVWLNRDVAESDLVIADGYIEPHFFAGYTGGGKSILPGVSGFETIKVNHGAAMIDHPRSRVGVLDGNPIYEDIVEGARLGKLDFSINVTLDSEKRITGVFAGDFEEAHRAGASFLGSHVRVKTQEADIAITTNGGYPLDRDLYQAVKGMTVAEEVVRDGGVIIIASECRDGVGHPDFMELVERSKTPDEILEIIRSPGFFQVDQWEAHVLARVLTRFHVICVTSGVEHNTVEKMHMVPAKTVEDAIDITRGIVARDPEIIVVPGGPSTIPFVRNSI